MNQADLILDWFTKNEGTAVELRAATGLSNHSKVYIDRLLKSEKLFRIGHHLSPKFGVFSTDRNKPCPDRYIDYREKLIEYYKSNTSSVNEYLKAHNLEDKKGLITVYARQLIDAGKLIIVGEKAVNQAKNNYQILSWFESKDLQLKKREVSIKTKVFYDAIHSLAKGAKHESI